MQTVQSRHSTLDKYILIKTLGAGYNSKVKLAYDPSTDQYFAIKTIRHSHPKLDVKTVKSEIETLTSLKHPNIVNLIDYYESVDYIKKNETSYKVVAIVLELVPNGNLLEYLTCLGKFREEVARAYFQILIETVDHCHSQGVAHRDLKLENLLLDHSFNLKIADFGFSNLISGKDNSGQLKTPLGTESYIAPEIFMKQPYSGPAVDLFACAVILFILITGDLPFAKANPFNDDSYQLICTNKIGEFWREVEQKTTQKFGKCVISDDFKKLIISMLSFDPAVRLTLPEIKAHPWYNGPVISIKDHENELREIKRMIDVKIESKRQTKKIQKLVSQIQVNSMPSTPLSGSKPYRGDITQVEKELSGSISAAKKKLGNKVNFDIQRTVKEYQKNAGIRPASELFIALNPNILLQFLCSACQLTLNDFSASNETYKVKGKAIGEEGTCFLSIIITKLNDDISCVEFHKKQGDVWVFYKTIEIIKKRLPKVELIYEEMDGEKDK